MDLKKIKKWFTDDVAHSSLTIVGVIMCVILVPILIVNCTLLIKSFVKKDEVPDFGGYLPMIVLTDSMYPDIKSGDLIICKTVDPDSIEIGDVITFYDPAGNGLSVVTHKVVDIVNEDGKISFKTRGINNNADDRLLVPADKLIAEYTEIRIPSAGDFAMFMQSTAGLIICVVVPIVLLVGYDMIRRRMYEQTQGQDVAVLMAELEALKRAQSEDRRAQSEDRSAQSEDRSAQSEDCSAQSEDRRAQSEDRSAQSEDCSAQSEDRSAQSDDESKNTD